MPSSWRSLTSRVRRLVAGRRPDGPRPAPAGHPLRGRPTGRYLDYAPSRNGRPDPGEIVWTWVAFEDDLTKGKDRPVLVVGRDGARLLGLMLSSRSEREGQPAWLALGPGRWDRNGRPSWVRLDRVVVIPEYSIRREGAVLDRARFDSVATALRRDHGWR